MHNGTNSIVCPGPETMLIEKFDCIIETGLLYPALVSATVSSLPVSIFSIVEGNTQVIPRQGNLLQYRNSPVSVEWLSGLAITPDWLKLQTVN